MNTALEQVAADSRFPQWMAKGNLPETVIKQEFIDSLKLEEQYAGLPSLFYVSSKLVVSQIYKSWFAIQKRSFYRLQKKKQWLSIVQQVLDRNPNDPSHEDICSRAAQWLSYCEVHTSKDAKKAPSQFHQLMQAAEEQTDRIDLLAIAYLLLNNQEIPEDPFVEEVLQKRFTKKEIEIERLEAKVNQQLPKGRDPLGEKYLEHLAQAISLPELWGDSQKLDDELQRWKHQIQIPNFKTLHYPFVIESSDKLYWPTIHKVLPSGPVNEGEPGELQSQDCLGVSFSGLKNCVFQIRCSRRQLHIFRRCHEEGNYFHNQENKHKKNADFCPPSWGLFPLRAVRLLWRPSRKYKSKKPWVTHRLYLQCTIDERLLSHNGTAIICTEKIEETKRKLQPFINKSPETLKKTQITCQKRYQSTLHRLQHVSIERPLIIPYIGTPELTLGVSLNFQLPLQASIINNQTRELVATITAPQLLQWEGFRENPIPARKSQFSELINRVHRQRIHWRKIREKEYSKSKLRQSKKMQGLGTYCDRLIAKRLIQWAQAHQVGDMILPSPQGLKESIEAKLQAEARLKFPSHKKLQKKYAKSIRLKYPHWSYSRLINCISECAGRRNLTVRILPVYEVAASFGQTTELA